MASCVPFHSPCSSGDNSVGRRSSATSSTNLTNRGSPTETDLSTGTATMSTQYEEDIYDVLDDAFVRINRIFEHLRKCGQNEATNKLARDMTLVLDDMVSSIEQLGPAQRNMMGNTRTGTSPADRNFPSLPYAPPTSKSWAAVTATTPTKANNGIVKYTPSDSVKRDCGDVVRVDTDSQRVVWVQPWLPSRPLKDITDSIKSGLGAIYSMAFSPEDCAVCVIFQHASSASGFIDDYARAVPQQRASLLGTDVTVSAGQPYPINAALKRMDPPHGERRRLTFARQQLFGPKITEARFRKELEDLVGKTNIEIVHLFNAGNATVVMSAVPLAALVRNHFMALARTQQSPYFGLMVTFSHDPCERQLSLPSQFGPFVDPNMASRPRRAYTTSTVGNGTAKSVPGSNLRPPEYIAAGSRQPASSEEPRATVDETNGWRTVKRR